MLDLQSRWVKDAIKSMKSGDYTSPELARMWRLANLYLITSVASVGLNASFGNLIANDSYQLASQWFNWMTGDPETDEGRKQKFDAFFGVGPVAGTIGGPITSDVLHLGELFELWKLNENGMPQMESSYNDAWKDKGDQSKLYSTMRTFNGQAARAFQYSLPQALKGDIFQAFKIETGLYPSKKIRDTRNIIADYVPDPIKDVYNKYVGIDSAPIENKLLNPEENLEKLSNQLGTNKFKSKFTSKF